jgi:quercetin dioxygenase-like cupin family protein
VFIQHLEPAYADQRGVITDILQHTPVDSVTIITCVKGAMRGNHYHEESVQYSYVLSGRLRAFVQQPGQPVETADLIPGDLLMSPPLERHAIHALEDSVVLVITRGPRGGRNYEADTIRVEPLHASR